MARHPTLPSEVIVYTEAPGAFDEIATLDASARGVIIGGGGTTARVVERLQVEAAKLGANGIVLEGFDDADTVSVGTGVGTESTSRRGTVAIGIGGAVGMFKTSGRARAVYVPDTTATP